MSENAFPLSKDKLLEAYRIMRTIREFEEAAWTSLAAASRLSISMPVKRQRPPAS